MTLVVAPLRLAFLVAPAFTADSLRFFAAAFAFLVTTALFAAARRFFVAAAFTADSLRFLAAELAFLVATALAPLGL